jgi:formylglycine-generating enzyme required for sulfatase activity
MFYRIVAHGTRVIPPAGMGYVNPGEFLMGDNFATSGDARPVRTVTLSAFFIDRREVTWTQWQPVLGWALNHGYDFRNPGYAAASNHPVADIDWYDAVKWCNARSEMEGLDPVYFTDATRASVYRSGQIDLGNSAVQWSGGGYRLPTEAEWEKAARGGLAGQQYPWPSPGSSYLAEIAGDHANYWGSGDPFDNGTAPVGFYDGHQSVAGANMANGFGLYDMSGNLAEICWDWYGSYAPGAALDPHGPETGSARVKRGGSWYDGAYDLRCATRRTLPPGLAGAQRGFRCVRGIQAR